ncbi:GNAT family N-acetyltransferase [Actinophytocola sp.]|uniref:GNAT family N-acetyltransferase n=1 Tax=Actinophytocola sp. TaxID=1872138 RepID=UPI002ED17E46
MRIRSGDAADVPALMAMFDEAVAWMVARGNTEQWGTQPWSSQPEKVEAIRKRVEETDLWIAELDGTPVGALITHDVPPAGVEPVDEPELYVRLLLTSRQYAGREIGARLLAYTRSLAVEQGVTLVRVDCYRGGDGSLVRYYERNGFVPTHPFTVGTWPGQVLEHRIVSP